MDERDEEEFRLRAEQIEKRDNGDVVLPTHVGKSSLHAQAKLSEREEKIWEVYLTLLSKEPQKNNQDGVQWAADAVNAFEKWVVQKRAKQK